MRGKTFGVLSINCEGPKTADRAVYRLVKAAADDLGVEPGVPQTGVSTNQKLERLYELMREYYDGIIFILDEIDMLEGPYQEAEYNSLIYQLSRARKLADFDGPISLTTITNYADFMKDLKAAHRVPTTVTTSSSTITMRRNSCCHVDPTNRLVSYISMLPEASRGDLNGAVPAGSDPQTYTWNPEPLTITSA